MNIQKRTYDTFRDLEFCLHNFNDRDYEFQIIKGDGDKWILLSWEKLK